MPVPTPELFWLVGQEVLDCVCEALVDQSACGCPCRSFVTIGRPVWDNCCDGQLVVYLDNIYATEAFPQQITTEIVCSVSLVGEFVVQLIRCVPTMTEDGTPPTSQELNDSSAAIYTDMYIATRAVICCLAQYKKYRRFTFRGAGPVGPQGGCAGFEIRFAVELVDPIPEVA